MAIRVGSVQLSILRVLWRGGRLPAKRITEELSSKKPIAHSTVQTLLRKLEAKGAVAHEQEDRTFVYYARVAESEVTRPAVQDLLHKVFHGSVSGLVAELLENEEVSVDELNRLRALIDSKVDRESNQC